MVDKLLPISTQNTIRGGPEIHVSFLLSYDAFGGVLGVALVGMLPLFLSSRPTWVVLPLSLLLSMLLGLLAHRSFFGISS